MLARIAVGLAALAMVAFLLALLLIAIGSLFTGLSWGEVAEIMFDNESGDLPGLLG